MPRQSDRFKKRLYETIEESYKVIPALQKIEFPTGIIFAGRVFSRLPDHSIGFVKMGYRIIAFDNNTDQHEDLYKDYPKLNEDLKIIWSTALSKGYNICWLEEMPEFKSLHDTVRKRAEKMSKDPAGYCSIYANLIKNYFYERYG